MNPVLQVMNPTEKMPGSKNELRQKAATLPHYKAASQMPITKSDGSAKRNIIRRHGNNAERKGCVSKFVADDGTLEEVVTTLDEKDPNFVSSDDPVLVSNFE